MYDKWQRFRRNTIKLLLILLNECAVVLKFFLKNPAHAYFGHRIFLSFLAGKLPRIKKVTWTKKTFGGKSYRYCDEPGCILNEWNTLFMRRSVQKSVRFPAKRLGFFLAKKLS